MKRLDLNLETTREISIANCEIFVISKGTFRNAGLPHRVETVAALNGIELNENTRLVDLWITHEACDNLGCGAIRVPNENGTDRVEYIRSYVPAALVESLKEGEEFTFKSYGYIRGEEEVDDEAIIVNLSGTTAQLKYRYKCMGPFEDAMI